MSKFCMYCGKSLPDEAVFCISCGKKQITNTVQQPINTSNSSKNDYYSNHSVNTAPIPNNQRNIYPQTTYNPPSPKDIKNYQQKISDNIFINKLSSKVKTEAIIWVVVASIQILMAIIYFISGITEFKKATRYYYDSGNNTATIINIITSIILIIVAIINYYYSSSQFKYAKEVKIKPTGIVSRYKPISGLILNLIYNLLFGGIVGVAGTIVGFVTRSFVMKNENVFLDIESRNKRNSYFSKT